MNIWEIFHQMVFPSRFNNAHWLATREASPQHVYNWSQVRTGTPFSLISNETSQGIPWSHHKREPEQDPSQIHNVPALVKLM